VSLVSWVALVGAIVLGFATAAWYGGSRSYGLWIGFVGSCFLLLALAIQVQQRIWKAEQSKTPEPPAFAAELKATISYHLDVSIQCCTDFLALPPGEETLQQITAAIYLIVTNLQNRGAVIEGFKLEGARDAGGPWIAIDSIPWQSSVFMTDDLAQAPIVDMRHSGFGFNLTDRELASGDVAKGWVFLKLPPLNFSESPFGILLDSIPR
jgi:hypothetical protein